MGGGGNFLILWGGHSCYEEGHKAHGGSPQSPSLGKTLGMDIVSERQCLNEIIFYFIEQIRESIMRCLRSHGKYQDQQQFCTERTESLSMPLNYTVLNK